MESPVKDKKAYNEEAFERLMKEAVGDADLHLSEIPGIDLYIDQILTLVAGKNAESTERYRDNVLTKTMINNYSKEGLVMPIKGKKYTREHIVQMLLIYSLKNSLAIGEIHRIINGIYEEGFDGEKLNECYEKYLGIKEKNRTRACTEAKAIIDDEGLDLSDSEDFFIALLGIISCSAYLKNIAVEMLEDRYPVPAEEEEEEDGKSEKKQKKVAKKEAKIEKKEQKRERKREKKEEAEPDDR